MLRGKSAVQLTSKQGLDGLTIQTIDPLSLLAWCFGQCHGFVYAMLSAPLALV